MKIVILCANDNSNYFKLNDPGLDIYTQERDAWTYNGNDPVICHAPCQQWSKLKAFARFNMSEKMLAYHCWELIQRNGGIFEHPAGSSFFHAIKANKSKIISVDQHWWNFPSQKRTYLYFNHCEPLEHPLNFNGIEFQLSTIKGVNQRKMNGKKEMKKSERSLMPVAFCKYLVDSIRQTYSNAPTYMHNIELGTHARERTS